MNACLSATQSWGWSWLPDQTHSGLAILLLDTPGPLVLFGLQLPPATWTQCLPLPPNQAGCSGVVQTMFHGERWAVSSSNRTGVLQRLQAPGPGKEPAGAMTPVLHMRTGSPVALTDLNEATGISNADAQSLSERNYLQ